MTQAIPYDELFDRRRPEPAEWDDFTLIWLVPLWLEAYDSATPWPTDVVRITQETLTYLFDLAPSYLEDVGDERVVAVWGRSAPAAGPRDKTRQAGFVPAPERWSQTGYDRGHFVAHAAGGGMDINFFPQARNLNRGIGERGRAWRAMERETARRPGTPLLVRPTYDTTSWVPATLDFCTISNGQMRAERFINRDDPARSAGAH